MRSKMSLQIAAVHGRISSPSGRRHQLAAELGARLPKGLQSVARVLERLVDGLGFSDKLRVEGRSDDISSLFRCLEREHEFPITDRVFGMRMHITQIITNQRISAIRTDRKNVLAAAADGAVISASEVFHRAVFHLLASDLQHPPGLGRRPLALKVGFANARHSEIDENMESLFGCADRAFGGDFDFSVFALQDVRVRPDDA